MIISGSISKYSAISMRYSQWESTLRYVFVVLLPPFPTWSKSFVPHLLAKGCNNSETLVSWETFSRFFCCLQRLEASQNSSGRVFSYGGLLASRLSSRVNDRKLCLLVFSANSAVLPISFPQVSVYKSGKPTHF